MFFKALVSLYTNIIIVILVNLYTIIISLYTDGSEEKGKILQQLLVKPGLLPRIPLILEDMII